MIVIVIISPILYYVRNSLHPLVVLLAIYGVHVMSRNGLLYDLFWFLGGSYFLNRTPHNGRYAAWGGGILFLVFCITQLFYPGLEWFYFKIPIVSLGLFSMLSVYDILAKGRMMRIGNILMVASGFTFFIYLYHEPTINIVRKAIVLLLGNSPISFAVSYLLSPWIFSIFAVCVGVLMKKKCNLLYLTLTGGR